ncbi:uncharacterized protein [Aegilops tauschii subsp. strangulata]|uniref:uncharacterized protein n=1 Tax=Aegilops tauschii subsp. strangulata TaxID=200361 RepID=UPI00098A0BC1|nr:uncharacterized protein LOC109781000 [Aegilops tauschii subsp. strangulata]
MKKTSPFEQNDQADEVFRDLKRMLSTAPVLAALADKEPTGIVLSSPKGDLLRYALQIHLAASNNVAKYEALVHDLQLAKELGVRRILCYGDSDLVVQQCSGEWDARDANMARYCFLVEQLSGNFNDCEFLHVLHAENKAVDMLAKIGSSRQTIPSDVSLEHLRKPSVKPSLDSESIFIPDDPAASLPNPNSGATGPSSGAAVPKSVSGAADPSPRTGLLPPAQGCTPQPVLMAVFTVVTTPSWAQPILAFLESGALPMDETEARQVQHRASAYSSINNELVKRSATSVFQRCIEQDNNVEILLDIHQGECGHHAASRSLVSKAFRHGFYQPMAFKDAESLVLKCEGCQRFGKRSHQPASALQTILITWPFAVWGLDMVGPFKTDWGGMMNLLVVVDKFTNWIEARPIKKLNGPTVVRFVKDIAVRYDILQSIITDNITNFAKGALAQYCSVSGIWLDLASIAHAQSNG